MIKQLIIVLLSSAIIVFLTFSLLFHAAGRQAARIAEKQVNAAALEDGQYQGKYLAFGKVPAATVQFSVFEKRLINFNIVDVLTIPKYDVKPKMLSAVGNQGLQFDAVSGATVSSQFVKAAIVNAVSASE